MEFTKREFSVEIYFFHIGLDVVVANALLHDAIAQQLLGIPPQRGPVQLFEPGCAQVGVCALIGEPERELFVRLQIEWVLELLFELLRCEEVERDVVV